MFQECLAFELGKLPDMGFLYPVAVGSRFKLCHPERPDTCRPLHTKHQVIVHHWQQNIIILRSITGFLEQLSIFPTCRWDRTVDCSVTFWVRELNLMCFLCVTDTGTVYISQQRLVCRRSDTGEYRVSVLWHSPTKGGDTSFTAASSRRFVPDCRSSCSSCHLYADWPLHRLNIILGDVTEKKVTPISLARTNHILEWGYFSFAAE